MCSGCHRETKAGYETARKSADCDDCHADAPGLVFFLEAEEIRLVLRGEGSDPTRNLLAGLFAEEELAVVDQGAVSLCVECAFHTEEVHDPVLIPESTGLRLFRGEVHVILKRADVLLGEKRIRSRVQVTDDPIQARRIILERLAIDAFRFICGTLEDE